MKSKFISAISIAFILVSFISTPVFAVKVTKSYRYDYNTVARYDTHYSNYHYIRIPSKSKYKGFNKYRVGGGWNYIRYERINHFSGGY